MRQSELVRIKNCLLVLTTQCLFEIDKAAIQEANRGVSLQELHHDTQVAYFELESHVLFQVALLPTFTLNETVTDPTLVKHVMRLMEEGLSSNQLAQKMEVKEYQLRQAIN